MGEPDDEIYEVRCGTGGCLPVVAVIVAVLAALAGLGGWMVRNLQPPGRTKQSVPLCIDREKLGYSANAPCETQSGEIIND